MQDYIVNISLMNIDGARLIYDENPYTEEQELGVFLPLKQANIYKNDKNYCYMSFYAMQLNRPMAKRTHYLKPVMSEENLKKARMAGSIKTRYLGKMFPVAERKY